MLVWSVGVKKIFGTGIEPGPGSLGPVNQEKSFAVYRRRHDNIAASS